MATLTKGNKTSL